MSDSIGVGGAVGITVAVFVAAIGFVAGILFKTYKPAYPPGPIEGSIFSFSLINWFKVLYYFLPYGLFLFGVIYDGLVRKIKFFPAGFIGLANVYLNWIISTLVNKRVSIIDKDICGIPGMSNVGSNIVPQNILFTTTVMSYIAAYITSTQSDLAYSGAAWGGVGIVALIGSIAFYIGKCNEQSWKLGYPLVSILGAIAGGLLVGGGSGALIANYVTGDSTGIGLSSEAKQSLVGGSGPAMAPTSGTAGAGKCSPTDSDDQFVCEAYKNGELVTSTIVE